MLKPYENIEEIQEEYLGKRYNDWDEIHTDLMNDNKLRKFILGNAKIKVRIYTDCGLWIVRSAPYINTHATKNEKPVAFKIERQSERKTWMLQEEEEPYEYFYKITYVELYK